MEQDYMGSLNYANWLVQAIMFEPNFRDMGKIIMELKEIGFVYEEHEDTIRYLGEKMEIIYNRNVFEGEKFEIRLNEQDSEAVSEVNGLLSKLTKTLEGIQ